MTSKNARLQIECGLGSVIYASNATTISLNFVSLELSQILLRQYFMLSIHLGLSIRFSIRRRPQAWHPLRSLGQAMGRTKAAALWQ
ncbi:hypothetical protein OIDMADRAFT_58773 [Oidiodendron maius Zn]|uniref:Uncharacterized protein n=1 Tax=Oidiodendron maius (strain Zn) TaxID=913774 RepID=A0A0C3D3E7_OIDMZ|nr:hypothetical protein OIDMADRAFT_58773 [Oidiodendron maius Zn]